MTSDRPVAEIVEELEAMLEGRTKPPSRPRFDLETDSLHGGVVGLTLPADSFEVAPGFHLRTTYSHLMAPFLLAFARPVAPSAPHPAPWKDLTGVGLDVTSEIHLEADARPSGFDRLNTLWFALSLLRLRTGARLQMPFVANMPIESASTNLDAARFIPVELRLFQHATAPDRQPTMADLEWIAAHFQQAARLATDPVFSRAYQTLDRAVWSADTGAGMVVAWAAIETLIRPGERHITDRISKALATLLCPPGPERDRMFAEVRDNYRARGGSVHDSAIPELAAFQQAFHFARAAMIKTIERGQRAALEELLECWSERKALP